MTINQLNIEDVVLANGFQLHKITSFSGDQNDIQYLCLSQDQSPEERTKLRELE